MAAWLSVKCVCVCIRYHHIDVHSMEWFNSWMKSFFAAAAAANHSRFAWFYVSSSTLWLLSSVGQKPSMTFSNNVLAITIFTGDDFAFSIIRLKSCPSCFLWRVNSFCARWQNIRNTKSVPSENGFGRTVFLQMNAKKERERKREIGIESHHITSTTDAFDS